MEKDRDELGCCGYDELAEKPATTERLVIGKAKSLRVEPNPDGPMATRRISYMGSTTSRYPVINVSR